MGSKRRVCSRGVRAKRETSCSWPPSCRISTAAEQALEEASRANRIGISQNRIRNGGDHYTPPRSAGRLPTKMARRSGPNRTDSTKAESALQRLLYLAGNLIDATNTFNPVIGRRRLRLLLGPLLVVTH